MATFRLENIERSLYLLVACAVLPALSIMLYTGMEHRNLVLDEAKSRLGQPHREHHSHAIGGKPARQGPLPRPWPYSRKSETSPQPNALHCSRKSCRAMKGLPI